MSKKALTLGSLFDGSGGFPLGGFLSGINPVWASEIEPFPVRVTTVRFPGMKHYGDISTLNGAELEAVDVITFGSPCQDMSVAGKRSGLGGSRSSLFYEAVRIIKEMRGATDGKYPRFIVWENVPGAFSSNGGEDFRSVLEEICRIKNAEVSVPSSRKWETAGRIMGDGFSLAWRQFDAQFWGVPQRRKRIYLVADLAGGSAGKILFESEGLSRYSAEGFRAWQRTASAIKEGFGETGDDCVTEEGCKTSLVFENHGQDARYKGPQDVSQTVLSTFGTGGNNQPFVLETPKSEQKLFQPKVYGICSKHSHSMLSENPHSGFYEAETSRCLDENGGNPSCNQGGMAVIEEERVPRYSSSKSSFFTEAAEGIANTLVATDYKDPPIVNDGGTDYIVRRLTPTECARLQGFPDWWCDGLAIEEPTKEDIEHWSEVFETHRKIVTKASKPKTEKQVKKWLQDPHTDSAEYRMWGNGVALPNVLFVLSGIVWAVQEGA